MATIGHAQRSEGGDRAQIERSAWGEADQTMTQTFCPGPKTSYQGGNHLAPSRRVHQGSSSPQLGCKSGPGEEEEWQVEDAC